MSNRVEFNDANVLQGILEDIASVQFETVEAEKKAIKAIGNAVKAEAEKLLTPMSKRPHVHMAKDVKVSVKYKEGLVSCIVGGGKETGYKWHMLDSGTRNPDGSIHTPATNFVSKALKNAEPAIEKILSDAEKGKV